MVTDACRLAVGRAYTGMIHSGAPPCRAFAAALVVLRWHQPGMTSAEAQLQLEEMLAEGTRH